MKKNTLMVFLVLLVIVIFSQNTFASGTYWAAGDIQYLKNAYNIEVKGDLDKPAEKDFQELIFKLVGLNNNSEDELSRYKLLYYMVNSLQIKDLVKEECAELLCVFEDTCKYCDKANMIPAKAKKAGLLRGRKTAEGLIMSINEPVTKAELAVLAVRYLKTTR